MLKKVYLNCWETLERIYKMGMYNFLMSCGHMAEREVADPAKYYNIDREYYKKQGLCDKCWDKLKTDKEKSMKRMTNK